jgi:helix-turn-helix protein
MPTAIGRHGDRRKGRRIVGAERATMAVQVTARYHGGESIRALAASTGRSYGFINRILKENNATLRPRGGPRQRRQGG